MTNQLPAGVDVDFELTRFVRRVRSRSLRNLATIHPKLDYGTFTFLLAIVDAEDGIRGSELADQIGVHKSTASRAVATLERLGLVSRVPDPDDGRAQLLVAQPVAHERVGEYRRSSHEILQSLVDDWSPDEIASFARSLSRLNERAEKEL
ncbi:MarR family winged helix-turn-helix transcriptional regulator [Aeromicrobium wangtongii]|uniref:MarR family winged helix-turn-helix transcriptional regulator n=1 Tax=Aeromicrobium wangtongii TaxID=2969247 RepID=A0ABY5MEN1_9ACTN|nr:MarR family winged helix-turn-helix transcriptional regulator [Aeromicrobium wangtongii]MCD9197895.1 MarR family winged helix-turn-helix transcriptional regulator [Aeromicrobium wangtongii]UUP15374.1 MarR family winged helix-turn-helix transcriptional regulator [Aeromicrobium wangtongii]